MTMRVEAFIIHLARAEKRRPQVEKLRRDLPVPAHVIDAVDGNALSAAEIEQVYQRHLFKPRYPFALRPGEIGCFLSHRRAWQAIVDRGLDAGLIVEDDVEVFSDSIAPAVRFAQEHLEPKSYVRFPWRDTTDVGSILARRDGMTIVEPQYTGLGTLGQLVGREAAQMLLEITRKIDRPIDTFIQTHWNHGVRVVALHPVCLTNLDAVLGGTTLADKTRRSLGAIVHRELLRAFYRLSVRIRCLLPRG